MFTSGHTKSKKKGTIDFRAGLTREAFVSNPKKCLEVFHKMIDMAHSGDHQAMRLFFQIYALKTPQEIIMRNEDGDSVASQKNTQALMRFYMSKGCSEAEAAAKILEFIEGETFLKEQVEEDVDLEITDEVDIVQ